MHEDHIKAERDQTVWRQTGMNLAVMHRRLCGCVCVYMCLRACAYVCVRVSARRNRDAAKADSERALSVCVCWALLRQLLCQNKSESMSA